jgi:hypothetical protein
MNAVFPKLPRSYAADTAWSRIFFQKKMKISAAGPSREPWNSSMVENAGV